ncbi:adenylate/guanylate cyclase domain-containing protein [Methylobacterium planeticum]|uniref:Adenylate/guanylate cyclase domain-containing protein n=1 Tax=Methylobacterium planeticum TaxID=2615211 RepID=A0A6N6MSV3_9HYPH|nr:adenylate/guanylate cyclase domain-containing protein [Methylobacterium planeticum]KAB1072497.1 adenylate/guanylate cyclase domain-containing protein [Methylobacterium planeticum]
MTLRQVRLGTGLVLFGYVLTHLLNHALGNISLAALDAGLAVASAIWLNPVCLPVLYIALTGHLLLGLYALYERRYFRWRGSDVAQLVLGLAVPLLLINHIVATRIAFSTEGLEKGYAQQLYVFWVASPQNGVMQAALLILAWVHGCLGLFFWLRLKPRFSAAGPWLLAGAVLVPVLALLGFVQGGRSIAVLAQDPAWRADALKPIHVGLPEQAARLRTIRDALLTSYALAIAIVVIARGLRTLTEMRHGTIRINYPGGRVVRVPRGTSVLEASQRHNIPHASVCGGRGRCSTCRVRVCDGDGVRSLPAPSKAELAVLNRIGATPGIRLACQLKPIRDLAVTPLFPPRRPQARRAEPAQSSEERFIVAMFVDLRGSTQLAEERLPYDTVFIINRFLGTVGDAVREAGGSVNQLLGDGMLALFGLQTDRVSGARQALQAVDFISEHVAGLNRLLAADLGQTLRYGIGLHAGMAIVGEMGDHADTRFAALGDTVNVASRLEGMTKSLGCVALVSEAVYEAAQVDVPALQRIVLKGRCAALKVMLVDQL